MPGKKMRSIKHPGAYEKAKQAFIRSGMSKKAAKTKAARLTNAGYGVKGIKHRKGKKK
jgi:hypothetical protein